MKFFKCGKCDKILEKKYVNNHPKSAITWYNADESEEKEKKVDDIAKAEEHEKEELRKKTPEELDEILESLKAELHELKNPKKETKEARRKYDVLGYDQLYSVSSSGDELLQSLGSVD